MNYTINIDHEDRIIHYKYPGLIERKDLGIAWKSILQIDEFVNKGYGLLSDYRNSKFNFTINDTDEIWSFLIKNKELLKNKCEAILTDNPENTVITILFEMEIYEKIGFEIKTFSTEPVALDWLKKKVEFIRRQHYRGE